jgi:hypothetical protein
MIPCNSNLRCAACPIERLDSAEDRVRAGEITQSTVELLKNIHGDSPKSLSNLIFVAGEKTAHLSVPELTPAVMGAAAISLARQCKVQE